MNRHERRSARHKKPSLDRSPLVATMLHKYADMLIEAGQSTYTPIAKGDHRPFAELTRARKAAFRSKLAWN